MTQTIRGGGVLITINNPKQDTFNKLKVSTSDGVVFDYFDLNPEQTQTEIKIPMSILADWMINSDDHILCITLFNTENNEQQLYSEMLIANIMKNNIWHCHLIDI